MRENIRENIIDKKYKDDLKQIVCKIKDKGVFKFNGAGCFIIIQDSKKVEFPTVLLKQLDKRKDIINNIEIIKN